MSAINKTASGYLGLLASSIAMISAQPATAQTAATSAEEESEANPEWSLSMTIDVLTDYRFRGVSFSDEEIVVQPAVTLTHRSGLYGSIWASNIDDELLGGSEIEVDFIAGYSSASGNLTFGLGGVYYTFFASDGFSYGEVFGNLSYPVGPVTFGINAAYAPSQQGTFNQDNFYVGTSAALAIPDTPIGINASIGLEDGAFGDSKIDWKLGATADVKGFTLGLSYVDTGRSTPGTIADAAILLSLRRVF